jgi:hypothetical protein
MSKSFQLPGLEYTGVYSGSEDKVFSQPESFTQTIDTPDDEEYIATGTFKINGNLVDNGAIDSIQNINDPRYFIVLIDDANFYSFDQYFAFFNRMFHPAAAVLLETLLRHYNINISPTETRSCAMITFGGHGEEGQNTDKTIRAEILSNYHEWFADGNESTLDNFLANITCSFAIGVPGPKAPMYGDINDIDHPRFDYWKKINSFDKTAANLLGLSAQQEDGISTSQIDLALPVLISDAFKRALNGRPATYQFTELLKIVIRHALRTNFYVLWTLMGLQTPSGVPTVMKKGQVWTNSKINPDTLDRILYLSPNDAEEETEYHTEPGCYPIFMCDEQGNQFGTLLYDAIHYTSNHDILSIDFISNNLKRDAALDRFKSFVVFRLDQLGFTEDKKVIAIRMIDVALEKIKRSILSGMHPTGTKRADAIGMPVYYSDIIIIFYILRINIDYFIDGLCRPQGKRGIKKASNTFARVEPTQSQSLVDHFMLTEEQGAPGKSGGARQKSKQRKMSKKNRRIKRRNRTKRINQSKRRNQYKVKNIRRKSRKNIR